MPTLDRNSIDLAKEVGIAIRLKRTDIEVVRDLSRYGYSDREIMEELTEQRRFRIRFDYWAFRSKYLVNREVLSAKAYLAFAIALLGIPGLLYAWFSYVPETEDRLSRQPFAHVVSVKQVPVKYGTDLEFALSNGEVWLYSSHYPHYEGLVHAVEARGVADMMLYADHDARNPIGRSYPIRTIMKVSSADFTVTYAEFLAYKRSDRRMIWVLFAGCVVGALFLGLAIYESRREFA